MKWCMQIIICVIMQCNARGCSKLATGHCGKCRSVAYCSLQCAKTSLATHTPRCVAGIFALDPNLVQGKTKREENDNNDDDFEQRKQQRQNEVDCTNERDIFTSKNVRDMTDQERFVLNGECFHLPSLYNWVVNEKKQFHPANRRPFSVQDVAKIRKAGLRQYPLTLNVANVRGEFMVYHTTMLANVLEIPRLVWQMNPGASQYDLLREMVFGERALTIVNHDPAIDETQLLLDYANEPIASLYLPSEVTIYDRRRLYLPSDIVIYDRYRLVEINWIVSILPRIITFLKQQGKATYEFRKLLKKSIRLQEYVTKLVGPERILSGINEAH